MPPPGEAQFLNRQIVRSRSKRFYFPFSFLSNIRSFDLLLSTSYRNVRDVDVVNMYLHICGTTWAVTCSFPVLGKVKHSFFDVDLLSASYRKERDVVFVTSSSSSSSHRSASFKTVQSVIGFPRPPLRAQKVIPRSSRESTGRGSCTAAGQGEDAPARQCGWVW